MARPCGRPPSTSQRGARVQAPPGRHHTDRARRHALRAETLTGHLLAGRRQVARSQGREVGRSCSPIPATWGEYKLDLLREAGRVAGLDDVGLVPEPVAAAAALRPSAACSTATPSPSTTSAAARSTPRSSVGPRRPEILGHAGGPRAPRWYRPRPGRDRPRERRPRRRPRRARPRRRRAPGPAVLREPTAPPRRRRCRVDTETTVAVAVPGLQTQVRITRVELEAAVRPRLAETLGALDRAMASAGLAAGDLAGVVLVGGSSRIPLVAEQVASHTGRPLLVDADPEARGRPRRRRLTPSARSGTGARHEHEHTHPSAAHGRPRHRQDRRFGRRQEARRVAPHGPVGTRGRAGGPVDGREGRGGRRSGRRGHRRRAAVARADHRRHLRR